jgi:hypothetical protein
LLTRADSLAEVWERDLVPLLEAEPGSQEGPGSSSYSGVTVVVSVTASCALFSASERIPDHFLVMLLTASPSTTTGKVQIFHNEMASHGKPTQNAYIERFNLTFRTEVQDCYGYDSLDKVRGMTADWI